MDINDQIAAHTGLIYKQLATFQLTYDQDAESFAYEALHRAILTFDDKAGVAFSTYAICVINNALRKHMRTFNRKRQLDVVSYDAPPSPDHEYICMSDMLGVQEDVESLLLDKEARAVINKAFADEYSALPDKHKRIIQLFYESDNKMTQQGIAKAAGVTQATVSKIISSFRYRLKLRLEEYK